MQRPFLGFAERLAQKRYDILVSSSVSMAYRGKGHDDDAHRLNEITDWEGQGLYVPERLAYL